MKDSFKRAAIEKKQGASSAEIKGSTESPDGDGFVETLKGVSYELYSVISLRLFRDYCDVRAEMSHEAALL